MVQKVCILERNLRYGLIEIFSENKKIIQLINNLNFNTSDFALEGAASIAKIK